MPQAGSPAATLGQRLLALTAAGIEIATGERVRDTRLDHPDPTGERHSANRPGTGLHQERRPALAVDGDDLVHAAAAHADLIVLRAERDLDEVARRQGAAGKETEGRASPPP